MRIVFEFINLVQTLWVKECDIICNDADCITQIAIFVLNFAICNFAEQQNTLAFS